MRITAARKGLADLARIGLDSDQGATCLSFELNDLQLEAQRRFCDIEACIYALQDADTSLVERARQTEMFASNKSELLEVITKVRRLISQWVP
jgi:hypothetical protein